ncbi:MAG: hypothetical protein JW956_14150, partial [Calditrichaceae bacterium]|nr:hypothetical protein [Calditrichaceae bacterium]
MLHIFFDDYLSYCKLLSLSGHSIKELFRYIKQLEEFLLVNGPDQLSNLQYKHLSAFVISGRA